MDSAELETAAGLWCLIVYASVVSLAIVAYVVVV